MRAPPFGRSQSRMVSTTRNRLAALAVVVAVSLVFAGNGNVCAQDPPQVKAAKATRTPVWVSFVAVGVVAVLGVAATLTFLNSRKRPAQPVLNHKRRSSAGVPVDAARTTQSALGPTSIDENPPPVAESLPADAARQTSFAAGLPPAPEHSLPNDGLTLPALGGPLSRGASVACGRCSRTAPAEAGLPPWCPHCGADLKATADTAPLMFGGAPGREVANLTTQLQPPYFHGRIERHFRVYVLPSKLLFLEAPVLEDLSRVECIIRGVSIQAGLVGWVIGSSVAGAIGDSRRSKTRNRLLMLDVAATEVLVEMAEREGMSFVADVDEVQEVRIEALTYWQNAFAGGCAARLQFRHPERGPMSVALPKPDDVRIAIKQLAAVFGERLTVNATWDWNKHRFVPRS
jgi:hypothetical protein